MPEKIVANLYTRTVKPSVELGKSRINKAAVVLIIFSVLDAVSLCRTAPLLVRTVSGVCQFGLPSRTILIVVEILRVLLFSSYAFSAYAFLTRKRWSFPLYYCQFPLRLLFFSMSLGFLALINRPFQSVPLHFTIGGIVALAEIVRLVVTIVIHRRANTH